MTAAAGRRPLPRSHAFAKNARLTWMSDRTAIVMLKTEHCGGGCGGGMDAIAC